LVRPLSETGNGFTTTQSQKKTKQLSNQKKEETGPGERKGKITLKTLSPSTGGEIRGK